MFRADEARCLNSIQTSYSGLTDAMLRLNVAANNIANANTSGYVPEQVVSVAQPGGGVTSGVTALADASVLGGVDLLWEGVQMILAKTAFTANAKAIGAALETERVWRG